MKEITNEKHKLIKKYGKDVLMKFVPRSRQDVKSEQELNIAIGSKIGKKVKIIWSNGVENREERPQEEIDVYPKSKVIQRLYKFRIGHAHFTLAVWEYIAEK